MITLTIDNGERVVSVTQEEGSADSTWLDLLELFEGALGGLGYSLGDFELTEFVRNEHGAYVKEKYFGK
jgi:hypothetical protein